ncbi:DapH/DapD/GlmU-related protein [Arthrobacter sp. lap29]|uniref:acyltransferase n=1 Tax=Arthrobacter sp. lap29 TaxID=3056122 RepID=UPI0028F71946|nr:DapH/DapD/GlmU-related protein [Arthrobacter sp. lap29]
MNIVSRMLSRYRPQQENIETGVLIGWYLRKGGLAFVRGFLWRIRIGSAKFPMFFGRRVSIMYGKNIVMGSSCVIGDNSIINAFGKRGITLGDSVTIREGAWIQCASHPSNPGEGLVVGSRTYIGPNSIIGVGGKIEIGEGCQFGSGVTLIAENHVLDEIGRASSHSVVRRGITIGEGCWLGHRVVVLDGVVLGNHCTVGAGAVVTRSFPEGSVLAGVPARLIS